MLQNPVKAVAPFLVLVQLEEGQQFDAHHTEAYSYETIGGNHSRIALQVLKKLILIDPTANQMLQSKIIANSKLYCVHILKYLSWKVIRA